VAGISADLDLILKYNQPGPRYTSYPPANHFHENLDRDKIQSLVEAKSTKTEQLSLYFHLPFCPTGCYYCGCTNIVNDDQSKTAEYLGYLKRELVLLRNWVNDDAEVVQIQLGGGTPSHFLPEEIIELGETIRELFPIAANVEAGIEIDPRRVTLEKVQAFVTAGFNRASLGVQDVNPDVQKAINRIQPFEQTQQTTQWLRDEGINSINFDVVYGLPKQSVESFTESLDRMLSLSPDRMAAYSYAHIPWIKPAQAQLESMLPTTEEKLELLRLAIEKLTSSGMDYIGMDHFAKPEDSMARALKNGTLQRNFQGYSTWKGVDLYGLGMSSISSAKGAYWQNHKKLSDYYAGVDAGQLPFFRGYVMNADDTIRCQAIMILMCNFFVDYQVMSDTLGVDFQAYFKDELASLSDLEDDGFLIRETNGLRVTDLGRLFIRNIAMRFDAYLNPEIQKRYSKTV
jgi:oxygen-independent coproporphyrinogen-3 oxidase